MHWVNRGPEPEGLEFIRNQYTPRWVKYYPSKEGAKPGDSRWRDFQGDLEKVFCGLCAYCETLDKGEVDHFRPKSRFPKLVYEWENWVFACHNCNHAKGDKWPSGGYVDPCAKSKSARPENFCDFDAVTGEIVPKQGLSQARSHKAQRMIDDLHLNDRHHLQRRIDKAVSISLNLRHSLELNSTFDNWLKIQAARSTELSSVARSVMSQFDYSPD